MSRNPISPKQLRLRITAVAMIPKLLQFRLGNKSHRAESPLGKAYILALPQEILDAILDFLFNDKIELKHCTLVLREWLCRARRHLFRDMNVLVTRLAEFRDFLAEDPAYVCNSIRFLKVKSQFSAAPVRLRDIHGCFMLLPAMDHLTLSSVSIARNEDRSPLGGAPTPGRFHKLTLSSMTVDAHDISQFLLLCPSRCELRLRRQCYMRQPSPTEAVTEEMNTLSITHGMKATNSRGDKGHVKTLVMGSWEHSQDGLATELSRSTNLLAGLISVYWHFIHDDAKRVAVKKFLETHGATLKWVGLDFLHFECGYYHSYHDLDEETGIDADTHLRPISHISGRGPGVLSKYDMAQVDLRGSKEVDQTFEWHTR
ncbi:hypothetical protein PHLGIDRAFT_491676 [Phlebiopsis gigantea 11061_1 CR5-6]|uniref:F-box domain-containing protein n=1 Tax=Phlebiopsis gigantea (strain 11061_1 CR5-6) TaxID=745531 RepID=A0A0C3RV11_PHLG1|nr:hypothetical protein PHLGIDRAFT_491676 [Phlebiopsis gigantea 11061_1 CR5-6]